MPSDIVMKQTTFVPINSLLTEKVDFLQIIQKYLHHQNAWTFHVSVILKKKCGIVVNYKGNLNS